MEFSTTSSEGSSRAADEGRDATPWAGEVREDLEDALEAAWEAYNAAVQGNGGTTGPRGKMTVDEASYFGTVSGRLVRATDANGGFRNTMGRDRVMLEGEPGTAFLRVSVPRGWGPAQVATNKIEAGPMSLAANLRL